MSTKKELDFDPTIKYDDDKKEKYQSHTASIDFDLPYPFWNAALEAYGADKEAATVNLLATADSIMSEFTFKYNTFVQQHQHSVHTPPVKRFGESMVDVVQHELDSYPNPLSSRNVALVRLLIEEKLYQLYGLQFKLNLQVSGKWRLSTTIPNDDIPPDE